MWMWGLLLLPAIIAVAGCKGKPAYTLVPVRGKVTYKGKPGRMVTVQLIPDNTAGMHGPTATGQTGEDGSFTLQSPPYGEGAVPGGYKLTLQQYGGLPSIPAQYANPTATRLKVEVPEAGLPAWDVKVPD
ncbi:MAG TPA: hypothetical protein VG013_29675 [Gemmataceae bacterium]|jgi:hypothetical protein|nr:hypothetical protein [Gemmataceae bacterium]